MGGVLLDPHGWEPDRPHYSQSVSPRDKDAFAKAFTRQMLETECADHPGWVEIMGVRLDLSKAEDAALAARWLDGQCSALAANFLANAQAERTI